MTISGFAQRDERRGDHGQAGAPLAAEQELVHPGTEHFYGSLLIVAEKASQN